MDVTSLLSNPTILLELFWTGVITTALTVYMETCALKTLSAAETTLIFSTEPLWGTAFAAAVMGEQLGMNAAVGAFYRSSRQHQNDHPSAAWQWLYRKQ